MQPTDRSATFSLHGTLPRGSFPRISRLIESGLDHLLALGQLDEIYRRLPPARDTDHFLDLVLDAFRVRYDARPDDLRNVPPTGSTIVVANHPFGAIEGVLLAHLLRRIRPDVRILANYMLERVTELAELFISVDPFGGGDAKGVNIGPLRQAVRWVKGGGLLLVFPAGAVSHWQLTRGRVTDEAWSPTIGRMARMTRAPVVPIYFHGANSTVFQVAGLLHARLRTALLPRELLNKAHETLRLRIGRAIPFEHMKSHATDRDLTQYLRARTYVLAELDAPARAAHGRAGVYPSPVVPVAPAIPAALLKAEIEALPEAQALTQSGSLRVYLARAEQIPWCLQEIGRLRETAFRAVGEGTGRAMDIDLFDSWYLHLLLWDATEQCIVGAYRLGLVDEILPRFGQGGLYTHSLFRYRRQMLEQMNPAIELGRSFVRAEYQKSFAPLMLLWRGIFAFVARHPRYAVLFGPVSISNSYQEASRRLLVDYLRATSVAPDLARYVRPRRPFRTRRPGALDGADLASIRDIDDISRIVAQIEPDSKGAPVLLRQYLRLGGRMLGFNADDQFSDALDGLVMVDLRMTEPRTLIRYMGSDAAAKFFAMHGTGPIELREAS